MSAMVRNSLEREAIHETKILEVVRSRLKEARRSRITGKLIIEIQLMKGGPSNADKPTVYTEVGAVFRILEE